MKSNNFKELIVNEAILKERRLENMRWIKIMIVNEQNFIDTFYAT